MRTPHAKTESSRRSDQKQARKGCHSTFTCNPPSPVGVPSRRRRSGIPPERCPGPRWAARTPRIAAGSHSPPRAQTVTCESTGLPEYFCTTRDGGGNMRISQSTVDVWPARCTTLPGDGEKKGSVWSCFSSRAGLVKIDVSGCNGRVANPLYDTPRCNHVRIPCTAVRV